MEEPLIVSFRSISVINLPCVDRVKEKNDVFVNIHFEDWIHCTETVVDAEEDVINWFQPGYSDIQGKRGSFASSSYESIEKPCGVLRDCFFLTYSKKLQENLLQLHVFDRNSMRAHGIVGIATINLASLLEDRNDFDEVEFRGDVRDVSGNTACSISFCASINVANEEDFKHISNAISYIGKSRYAGPKAIEKYSRGSLLSKKEAIEILHARRFQVIERSCKNSDKLMDRFEMCDRGGQFELDISGLSVFEWPKQISIFPSIRKLYAHANMLKMVPALSYFTNIETINISRNQLEDISGVKFSTIRTLKNLDVSRNLLTSLPPDIVLLPILENLQIHRNKLTMLPSGISELRSLKVLNAEFNDIFDIVDDFGQLPKLCDVNLSGNPRLNMNTMSYKTQLAIELRNTMADKHERKIVISRVLDLTRSLRNSEVSKFLRK